MVPPTLSLFVPPLSFFPSKPLLFYTSLKIILIYSIVVSESQSSLLDYYKLKTAVAALPHDTLVHELISLFSNNSLEIELGIAEHLGRELVAEWVAKAQNIPPVKFLSHVYQLLETKYLLLPSSLFNCSVFFSPNLALEFISPVSFPS